MPWEFASVGRDPAYLLAGQAAKHAMRNPHAWSSYESTDRKIVWFHEGPTAFDYRVILNRVDLWAEPTSDAPEWVTSATANPSSTERRFWQKWPVPL